MHGTFEDFAPTVAEPTLADFNMWLEGEVARRGAETGYARAALAGQGG